jgi:hypothetical protein
VASKFDFALAHAVALIESWNGARPLREALIVKGRVRWLV